MSTAPRFLAGGIVYHVLNRANDRSQIFQTPGDYLAFLQTFAEAQQRVPGVACFAYCVMPNHWHLVLRSERDGEITEFVHWLSTTHAKRWRAFHESEGNGHLYQGRFRAFPVQDDAYFLTVCRYVERNPLRAQLVDRAEQWQWSSLRHRLQPITKFQPALRLDAWPTSRPSDDLSWIHQPHTPAELDVIRSATQHGKPFGDAIWCERTADRLGIQLTPGSRGRHRKH